MSFYRCYRKILILYIGFPASEFQVQLLLDY